MKWNPEANILRLELCWRMKYTIIRMFQIFCGDWLFLAIVRHVASSPCKLLSPPVRLIISLS